MTGKGQTPTALRQCSGKQRRPPLRGGTGLRHLNGAYDISRRDGDTLQDQGWRHRYHHGMRCSIVLALLPLLWHLVYYKSIISYWFPQNLSVPVKQSAMLMAPYGDRQRIYHNPANRAAR